MTQTLTIVRSFQPARGRRSAKVLRVGPADAAIPSGRVPRVARLMALAIRFDGLIRDRVVADQAELARLGQVTPARLSQIMNLLNLAPDIQVQILFLPRVERGRDRLTERHLRPIAVIADWRKQRRMVAQAEQAMATTDVN